MPNIMTLTTRSGGVAFCGRRDQFVVDIVLDGFDLYKLDKGRAHELRSFRTRPSAVRLPKQVCMCEDDKVVVGGSDHGKV
jgi:hypothetical protein